MSERMTVVQSEKSPYLEELAQIMDRRPPYHHNDREWERLFFEYVDEERQSLCILLGKIPHEDPAWEVVFQAIKRILNDAHSFTLDGWYMIDITPREVKGYIEELREKRKRGCME